MSICRRYPVVDRERVLGKLDDLDRYLGELREVLPADFSSYQKVVTKRACERLLQIAIETVIDVCSIMVAGLRLGLPSDEEDLFEKLEAAKIIPPETKEILKRMKGMRNILVHEYGRVNDRIVYEALTQRLRDFDTFRSQILRALTPGLTPG